MKTNQTDLTSNPSINIVSVVYRLLTVKIMLYCVLAEQTMSLQDDAHFYDIRNECMTDVEKMAIKQVRQLQRSKSASPRGIDMEIVC